MTLSTDVRIWKRFPQYRPVWLVSTGHRMTSNKYGALIFFCFNPYDFWTNGRVSGDLRYHDAHVIMKYHHLMESQKSAILTAFILCGEPLSRRLHHTEPWWRHQMETFSALLAFCAGNSPVTGEFPTQRPVTRGFDVFFDLRLNKRLSKQPWGWWTETPSWSLWRHCNV